MEADGGYIQLQWIIYIHILNCTNSLAERHGLWWEARLCCLMSSPADRSSCSGLSQRVLLKGSSVCLKYKENWVSLFHILICSNCLRHYSCLMRVFFLLPGFDFKLSKSMEVTCNSHDLPWCPRISGGTFIYFTNSINWNSYAVE